MRCLSFTYLWFCYKQTYNLINKQNHYKEKCNTCSNKQQSTLQNKNSPFDDTSDCRPASLSACRQPSPSSRFRATEMQNTKRNERNGKGETFVWPSPDNVCCLACRWLLSIPSWDVMHPRICCCKRASERALLHSEPRVCIQPREMC